MSGATFFELIYTLWDILKIFVSLLFLILYPISFILKFILYNIMNFISLLISSVIILITFFYQFIKSLSEYFKFIPQIINNTIKSFNIILEYIIYILVNIYRLLLWWLGFAENGNEDEFF